MALFNEPIVPADIKTRAEFVRKRIVQILEEYEVESNIPINHDYWKLRNEYLALRNKKNG